MHNAHVTSVLSDGWKPVLERVDANYNMVFQFWPVLENEVSGLELPMMKC